MRPATLRPVAARVISTLLGLGGLLFLSIASKPAPGAPPADGEMVQDLEATPARPSAPAALSKRRLTPLAAAIQARVEVERNALAALQARFKQARDPVAALAVQREIESVKQATELDLLRIQADFARRAGRLEAAQKIEQAIEEMVEARKPRSETLERVSQPAPQR